MLEIGMSTIGLSALVFLLYVLFMNKDLKIINMKTDNGQESKKSEPLKVVKLYTDSGTLLKSYEGVYLSHWDKKIYHLYTEEDRKLIVRLDIGANMLLTSENVNLKE